MKEESQHLSQSQVNNESRMKASRVKNRKKQNSKLSQYETTLQNFMANEKNQRNALQKINPKGLVADAIYVSFSGVIETAQLFLRENQDFQVSYQIIMGQQWHDQTPEIKDTDGISPFCQAINGVIHFSLNFDCLLSCVYIQSWPQLIMTIKGFSPNGDIITKGYAQIHLPIQSGQKMKQAHIYSIHREERWYQRLFRFLEPNPLTLDQKDFQRIIARGEGRDVQRIRSIGKIHVRTQTLKRNYGKFGYK